MADKRQLADTAGHARSPACDQLRILARNK